MRSAEEKEKNKIGAMSELCFGVMCVRVEREHLHHLRDDPFVVCLINCLVIETVSFKSYLFGL